MRPVTGFQSERQQVVHYFLGGWVQKRRGSVRFTAEAAVELWTLTCLALMLPHQMQPDGCMWSVCSVFLSVCGIQTIFFFPPGVSIHIWTVIYCVQYSLAHISGNVPVMYVIGLEIALNSVRNGCLMIALAFNAFFSNTSQSDHPAGMLVSDEWWVTLSVAWTWH